MAFILHIETTSTVCSVALSDNNNLIASKEINNGYSHAENLHAFIQELLLEANLSPQQLQAVSISKGPGSYTGLRIGYSAAKGLCYVLNIPLIAVDTLQMLAYTAKQQLSLNNPIYCPLIDARRMEVYYAKYNEQLIETSPAKALIINETSIIELMEHQPNMYLLGDGMPKTREFIQSLNLSALYIEGIKPSATALISLAYTKYVNHDFEVAAYAEPFYLKEFYFTQKK